MNQKKDTFEKNIQEIYKRNNGIDDIQYHGESFGGTNIDSDTAFFKVNINGMTYDVKVCNNNEMLF